MLDVGTGPGILTPYLRPLAGISGRVFASDLFFPIIRQARRKSRICQEDTRPWHKKAEIHKIASYPWR